MTEPRESGVHARRYEDLVARVTNGRDLTIDRLDAMRREISYGAMGVVAAVVVLGALIAATIAMRPATVAVDTSWLPPPNTCTDVRIGGGEPVAICNQGDAKKWKETMRASEEFFRRFRDR